jgi:hypothetical protein
MMVARGESPAFIATPTMTATARTHNWFSEITTAAQLRAMRKPQLSEILYRTGHNRCASASKESLVGMVCMVLKIYN